MSWSREGLTISLTLAAWSLMASPTAAQEDEIKARPILNEVTVPLVISSAAEHLRGPLGDYAPLLDAPTRIIANQWVRAAILRGAPDSFNDFQLSPDVCLETGEPRSDLACTLMSPADADRLEYRWATDTAPRSTAMWDDFNSLAGGTLAIPEESNHSLMNPGSILRFFTGPTVIWDKDVPWSTLPGGPPRGEDSGFLVESIVLMPSSPAVAGESAPLELEPHQRVAGVLVGGTEGSDAVYLTLPPTENAQTLAVWAAVPEDFMANVYARCGEKPTRSTYDWLETFGVSSTGSQLPAFLRLHERSDETPCTEGWHIVIENPAPEPGATSPHIAFNLRWGENYVSRTFGPLLVGIEFPTSGPDEEAWIRRAVREGAWRMYGLSGGTQVIDSFSFDPAGSCSNVTICWRNRPTAPDGSIRCEHNTGQADPSTGSLHICVDTSSPTIASTSHRLASAILAHEFAHIYLGLGDEYWGSNIAARICNLPNFDFTRGVRIRRCSHCAMSIGHAGVRSLCTAHNHDGAPEYLRQTLENSQPIVEGIVRGPYYTVTECFDDSVNYAGAVGGSGAWAVANATGHVPIPFSGSTADNYDFDEFASADRSAELWDIGRILN